MLAEELQGGVEEGIAQQVREESAMANSKQTVGEVYTATATVSTTSDCLVNQTRSSTSPPHRTACL